jgi:hypothetical protein
VLVAALMPATGLPLAAQRSAALLNCCFAEGCAGAVAEMLPAKPICGCC